jgi:hypothetical protein
MTLKELGNRWRNFKCWMDWHCMGWGNPEEAEYFDGASFGARCPNCKEECLMDSQGNWFGIGKSFPR